MENVVPDFFARVCGSTVCRRWGPGVRALARLLQALAVGLKPGIECRRCHSVFVRFPDVRRPFLTKGGSLHFVPTGRAGVPKHIHTFRQRLRIAGITALPAFCRSPAGNVVRTLAAKEEPTETASLNSASGQPDRLKTTALGGSRPPLRGILLCHSGSVLNPLNRYS
jgi:hypothetical protein